MTPEGAVRQHLRKLAIKAGFNHRKLKWIGHNGAPDEFIFWSAEGDHAQARSAGCAFIEVKRFGEQPTDQQNREHARLRAAGLQVFVVDSKLGAELVVSLLATKRLTD